jgi:hypothetical protein
MEAIRGNQKLYSRGTNGRGADSPKAGTVAEIRGFQIPRVGKLLRSKSIKKRDKKLVLFGASCVSIALIGRKIAVIYRKRSR